MMDRIEVTRAESDTSFFYDLMLLGEMAIKINCIGLISAIQDEKDRHRYRLLHRLVRADGIGDWASIIDEATTGVASQHLYPSAQKEQQALSEKVAKGIWQYEAVAGLYECLKLLDKTYTDLSAQKTSCMRWFLLFAELRNRTRGHGAAQPHILGKICEHLQSSIHLFIEKNPIFDRPWFYLHRNLSGKYRVSRISSAEISPEALKRAGEQNLLDGVYVLYDQLVRAELIYSDPDLSDFFLPNGKFNDMGKKFESISYITGNTSFQDASAYMAPPTDLPPSETQGLSMLDVQGKCHGNLPQKPEGYIARHELERNLQEALLLNDRYPIVTLSGRGGIGKTSLALSVLHRIKETERFCAIIWFSARDVDLLADGPKPVKPKVMTVEDMAKELVALTQPSERGSKGFKALEYFATALRTEAFGAPILYIFDNFETVKNPSDLYRWIDANVRLPNKVLITTRVREFKADYPIEVSGMNKDESSQLTGFVAKQYGVYELLTKDYEEKLFDESSGHPYVIKVLLGEVAKAKALVTIQRIVAGKEDILDALFQRTYRDLTPPAQYIFLTLCNWRSSIPQLALEAVMIHPRKEEKMDVVAAVDELVKSSFVDQIVIDTCGELYLSVPLVAFEFGRKQLSVSPFKARIEADTEYLRLLGATQGSSLQGDGFGARIRRMFQAIAVRVSQNRSLLDQYLPVMEFIARKYNPAFRLLADMYTEIGEYELAKDSLRNFLQACENAGDRQIAWQAVATICKKTKKTEEYIFSLYELIQTPGIDLKIISDAANELNFYTSQSALDIDTETKKNIIKKFIDLMSLNMRYADATDHSRLAWLYYKLENKPRAIYHTELGLRIDPNNPFCQKLASFLGQKQRSAM